MIGYKRTLKFILYADRNILHDSLVPTSTQLSPESESLKVIKPTTEWRGKHQLVEYQMKERRKEIKTWESWPSIDFNYFSLNWISNNIHEVLDAGRYDIDWPTWHDNCKIQWLNWGTNVTTDWMQDLWSVWVQIQYLEIIKWYTNVFLLSCWFLNSIVPKWNLKARTLKSYVVST